MKKILTLILGLCLGLSAYAQSGEITAAQWAQPRHGEWLLQQDSVAAVMRSLQQHPEGRVQIRYPGGDQGAWWAEEVQAWLVAMGLPSYRIVRVPGSTESDRLQLQLLP